jgi:hypothetical protein
MPISKSKDDKYKKPKETKGASTGGVGSGIGGAGTGGAATGGASTGGAGTVTLNMGGKSAKPGDGGQTPLNLYFGNIGGSTSAGDVASGDGPGSPGTGGKIKKMADGGVVSYTPPVPAGTEDSQDNNQDQTFNTQDKVKNFLMKMFDSKTPDSTLGTETTGLQGVANNIGAGGTGDLTPKMAGGGYVSENPGDPKESGIMNMITDFLAKKGSPIRSDQSEVAQADAIDPSVQSSTETVRGYADGGIPDPTGAVDVSQLPQFDPQAGMPPPAPMPTPQPQSPVSAPSPLSGYITGQKAQLNQYGPEQQMAVQRDILKRQNSPGSLVGQGLAGMGDALMQGVARAGNPGFLAGVQNRQNQQGQMQIEGMKNAREANLSNISEQMKLTAKDPTSPLSRSAQSANANTLNKLGLSRSEISQLPADLIPGIVSGQISLKEAQAKIAEAQLYHQLMGSQATAKLAQQKEEFETANPIKTFIAKHFGGSQTPATAPGDSGPYGPKTQRGGKTYVWSPVSKQYHPE